MDIKKHHEIYNACWKFFRKTAERLPLTDDEWNGVVAECSEICNPYVGTEHEVFARMLMVRVIMPELERLDKRARIEEAF